MKINQVKGDVMDHFKALFSLWIIMLTCSSLNILGFTTTHNYVLLGFGILTLLFASANTFFYYKRNIKGL